MFPPTNRREFISALGMGAAALSLNGSPLMASEAAVKPIAGSWFEFQHHATEEGVDWNPQMARFTAKQWEEKIGEMAEAGMEYLVLMATAVYYRSFYQSKIFRKWDLECPDPLEAVLAAADKYGIKFFIGTGFYGNWVREDTIVDAVAMKRRLASMHEVLKIYGHHKSFYGWYWPDETGIGPRFSKEFIGYVNELSHEARQLTPKAPIMIAPYGTRQAVADDEYVRQLDSMDCDILAYQDEVGVRKSKTTETAAFYAALRKAHDRSQRSKLWADVELFEFEGDTYGSALVPASFERVRKQLEAVSPYVDKILVYQYLGMMNKPGSRAMCGAPESTRLYSDYQAWRHKSR